MASSSRKRKRSPTDWSGEPTIQRDVPDISFEQHHPRRGRAASPSKTVRFPRRLEKRATPSLADHRHQSPSRPALQSHDADFLFDEGDGGQPELIDPDTDLLFGLDGDAGDQLERELHEHTQHSTKDKQRQKKVNAGAKVIPRHHAPNATESTASSHIAEGPAEDDHVCTKLKDIQALIADLAEAFPNTNPPAKMNLLDRLLVPENARTVRYIGYLALGGPDGRTSWERLLADRDARKALVWGIVGRALKEHVFGALWFGATDDQQSKLEAHEQRSTDKDGKHILTLAL
jgi:hypothetical protein